MNPIFVTVGIILLSALYALAWRQPPVREAVRPAPPGPKSRLR